MFLHKFYIHNRSMTRTKVSPTVSNLPSNDEITRFDGTGRCLGSNVRIRHIFSLSCFSIYILKRSESGFTVLISVLRRWYGPVCKTLRFLQ